jgi:methionine-S-sulfoxide reductase
MLPPRVVSLTLLLASACHRPAPPPAATPAAPAVSAPASAPALPAAAVDLQGGTEPAPPPPAGLAVATFAGGCFWCLEAAFEGVPGVRDAVSGYTGGPELHPGYEQVSNHGTGHAEAVRVLYDPARVSYEQLLHTFWRRIDPTAVDRSFADVGHQYRSAIFVHSPAQRAAAEASRREVAGSGVFREPIVTTVEDAPVFWVAEDYHQNFYRTHPERYHAYHEHSGRREFLRARWGEGAPY